MSGHLLKALGLPTPTKGAPPAKAAVAKVEMGGAGTELTLGIVTGPRLTELWALMAVDGAELGPSNNKGLGAQLNRLGRGLVNDFVRVDRSRATVYEHFDAIVALRDKSKAQVAKFRKDGTGKGNPVGKHAKGAPGTRVDTRVQNYLDGLKDVAAAFPDVKAAWDDMFAATAALKATTSEAGAKVQQRVVKGQEDAIQKEKERADEMKKRMNGLIGIGIKIVSPAEWAEVAGEAAKFVGEQLVDQIPTGRMEDLEKDLKQARTTLEGIEDEAAVARAEQAGHLLDAANQKLDKAKILMSKVINKLRDSQQGAVEVLAETKDTAGAAHLIEDRTRMVKSMADIHAIAVNHLASAATLSSQVTDVLYQYQTYPQLVTRADSGIPADGAYARSLISTANGNAETLRNWQSYLADFDASVKTIISEVADQSPDGFMAPFDDFQDALQDALVNR